MRAKGLLAAFLLAVGLCFVPVSAITQQTPIEEWTYDGYWWNELRPEPKLFFLVGYHTALDETYTGFWIGEMVRFWEENPDEMPMNLEDTFKYAKIIYDYYREYEQLVGFQYRQILEGINSFYDDFRNKTIDITNAIRVVGMQLHNKSEEDIDLFIKSLRESAGN